MPGYFQFAYFDLSLAPASGGHPDLPAAMVAHLRATPAVVAAFGEDTGAKATTKFHADFAPSGVGLPWGVYEEIRGDVMYMTPKGGVAASIESGQIRWTIVGEGRKAVRDLGKLIADTLNDAPLTFDDGTLMDLRSGQAAFVPVGDVVPGSPATAARVIILDYMVQRSSSG